LFEKKKIKKGETTAKGGRHPKKNDTGHVKKRKKRKRKRNSSIVARQF
jgi:hypothetical protein